MLDFERIKFCGEFNPSAFRRTIHSEFGGGELKKCSKSEEFGGGKE
jgi:hypothetical protein